VKGDLVSDRHRAKAIERAEAKAIRGRGTAENPPNRFETLAYVEEADWLDELGEDPDAEAPSRPRTLYLRDPSRSALSHNKSPDLGFDVSLNPYRGCEHGCVYCYARPTHEYLGFSAGLDFETRILVKDQIAKLLRKELAARKWRPRLISLSGVTDPYQPVERRVRLTRQCLRVLADFRNPVGIVTKNARVTRDIDILQELASWQAARVLISITTLDSRLHRLMEPRTPSPQQRLKAVQSLADAGVPVGVIVAPIIPGLNDHEIPRILEAAGDSGAQGAAHVVLRLPYGVKDLFEAWLKRHFPDRATKVLNRVRSMRGGQLNDSRFSTRMKGEGFFADEVHSLFEIARRRAKIGQLPELSSKAFRPPGGNQMDLF
jgi:DNA repair photolyase